MLRTTPRQSVVSLREKLQNYDQADELFTTLERHVAPRVLYDQRGAIFHRCLEGDGEIDCEALRFLKHPVAAIRGLKVYESQRALALPLPTTTALKIPSAQPTNR
jgi:hypothetical protein